LGSHCQAAIFLRQGEKGLNDVGEIGDEFLAEIAEAHE